MSYLYFAQTSTADGTRDKWTDPTSGQTAADTSAGVVNGVAASVAQSSFNESVLQGLGWASGESYLDGQLLGNGSRALYDLSDADTGTAGYQFNSVLGTLLGDAVGNVLGVGAANQSDVGPSSANNRTLDNASDYSAKKLNIGLADINWNDIKNVEVRIDSVDTGTGFDALMLRSFVDARVKIGDTEGCRDASKLVEVLNGTAAKFAVEIVDGKRGQVDGSQSDLALAVKIDVWTNNSGWQNSFSNDGSVFGDTFTISYGSLTVVKGISEFGLGAGKLVDDDGAFTDEAGQESAYNGQLTTLFTNMGSGKDTYDATKGVSVAGAVASAAELQTIDYVWGGSGNDAIKGGGNNDFLFGDFGSVVSVGQSADPAALSLKLGASGDNYSDWVVPGVVAKIWQQNTGGAKVDATAGNWDGEFRLNPGYATTLVSGGVGVGTHAGTSGNNGANGINPEINTGTLGVDDGVANDDVLGISFVAAMSAAKVGLGLFYMDDVHNTGLQTETALVTLTSGGVAVATYKVSGNPAVAAVCVSGTDGFDLSLAGGGDMWDTTDPGESTLHITTKAGASFDGMEFRSGGMTAAGLVSDFYLTDTCATVAAVEGNDTIDGGSGKDLIEGGGDHGAIVTTTTTTIVSKLPFYQNLIPDGSGQPAAAVVLDTATVATTGGIGFTALGAIDGDNNGLYDGWVMRVRNQTATDGTVDIQAESGGPIVVDDQVILSGQELIIYIPDTPESATAAALGSVTYIAKLDAPSGGAIEATNTKSSGSALWLPTTTQTVTTTTYVVGDDLTGGTGADTFVWNQGDGLDVVRDFEYGAGPSKTEVLKFENGGASGVLTDIDFDGNGSLESVLVRSALIDDDGVILQGVLSAQLAAGDIVWA